MAYDLFLDLDTGQTANARPASPQSPLDGVRERAAKYGCDHLADIEALALLLGRFDGQAAATHAHALLSRHGSFGAVLGASLAQLSSIVGDEAALGLKLVHDAMVRTLAEGVTKRCVISSWSALLAYLKATVQHDGTEQFRCLYLDKKNQLIADELCNRGTVDHAPVYPRAIAKRALELDASSVILAHNHPSGDPTPSQADVEMTRQVSQALRTLNIAVHDHVVIGREGVASFKALGLI